LGAGHRVYAVENDGAGVAFGRLPIALQQSAIVMVVREWTSVSEVKGSPSGFSSHFTELVREARVKVFDYNQVTPN